MVTRTNRASGDQFYGCSRYPDCQGTRPIMADRPVAVLGGQRPAPRTRSSAPPPRYQLSAGGRPRSLPDYVELLVARRLGRNLGPLEGGVVQIVALLAFGVIIYWAFASGLVAQIAELLGRWMASQMHFGPTPAP
jgi:ssDNA-binding Zn-finger/Zn-ribbon topoisomerase 1